MSSFRCLPQGTRASYDKTDENGSRQGQSSSEFNGTILKVGTKCSDEISKGDDDVAIVVAEPEGVCLTWEDLWITVSSGKDGNKAILQGLTGYAKPGQLLAIMGPSGCGKTTLLDALAGILIYITESVALYAHAALTSAVKPTKAKSVQVWQFA